MQHTGGSPKGAVLGPLHAGPLSNRLINKMSYLLNRVLTSTKPPPVASFRNGSSMSVPSGRVSRAASASCADIAMHQWLLSRQSMITDVALQVVKDSKCTVRVPDAQQKGSYVCLTKT